MASFIQEKNKTWTCEYLKTKPNGTESRTNKRGFKTKKEALQWHTNYEQQVSMGVNLDASAMTIATWMDQWLQTYCVGRAANTIASHRNNTRHIKEWIGGYTLKSIRPEHIQSFYNSFVQSTHKKGKTYSAAMLERVHCTLNAAMRRAVANRYIVFNPCDLLDRPQKEPPEKLYCPSDQLSTLLQLSKETDFYIPILLCCMLGLRRGEALGLKWDDIEGDIVHIRMQVTQDNYAGGYVYKSLKTKRAMRDLTLPDILRKELKNQYKKHASTTCLV